MNNYQNLLKIAAGSNISVLLLGESGVGKEVAARFIHQKSNRKNNPFVALNCGAIAKGLTESILEGHSKGAFTGASESSLGVVRSAQGGTLFLDEIGELPFGIQSKLLRILQEHSVMPIGTFKNLPVDFRLICATNRDLRGEVYGGRFREDLFFRLNVFPIKLPPLRMRNDFSNIAADLWGEFNGENPLNNGEIQLLKKESWPGNIRQLKNVLERYALLKPYGKNLSEILKDEFLHHTTPHFICESTPKKYAATPNWGTIYSELLKNDFNKSITAQKLGISRGCLCYQIKKHQPTNANFCH